MKSVKIIQLIAISGYQHMDSRQSGCQCFYVHEIFQLEQFPLDHFAFQGASINNIRKFLVAAKPSNSSRGRFIFFLLSNEVQKKGPNRPKLSKQIWQHMKFEPKIPNLRSDLTSEAIVASEATKRVSKRAQNI